MSTNGTFCNDEPIRHRRRLADGDVLRLGRTTMVFRNPGATAQDETVSTTMGATDELARRRVRG